MNLQSMETALKRFGFDDSDPLDAWLNAALHEFEDAADWLFLIKTVDVPVAAGTNDIGTPNDYLRTVSIRHSSGFKLTWKDPRDFDREIVDFTQQGTPEVYTTLGLDILRFYPVAQDAFTASLLYESTLNDMVDPLDVPGVPQRYHYTVIVQLAAAIALQAENEEDRSANARAQGEAALARAIVKYARPQADEFRAVKDLWGYGD